MWILFFDEILSFTTTERGQCPHHEDIVSHHGGGGGDDVLVVAVEIRYEPILTFLPHAF